MPGEPAQSDPSNRDPLLASIIDQLACPACLAALQMEASGLVCCGCGRGYPIVDGIPVLTADQAHQD